MTLGEFLIDKQPGFKFQNTAYQNNKRHYELVHKTEQLAVLSEDDSLECSIHLHHSGQWAPYIKPKKKKTIFFYRYYFRQDQTRSYHVSIPTLLAWEQLRPTENVNTSYTLIDTQLVHSIEVEE